MGRHDYEIRKALLEVLSVTGRTLDGQPTTVAGSLDDAVDAIAGLIYDITNDHRHYVEDLYVGARFFSPAARWETVTRVDDGGHLSFKSRVWTDKTGPDYAWRLYDEEKVDAVMPRPEYFPVVPEVRVIDLAHSMAAVVTCQHVEVPDFRMSLVSAQHLGKGRGWQVLDWPGDGDGMVTTEHPDKPKARTALMAAARVHAKALGLKVRKENGRGT